VFKLEKDFTTTLVIVTVEGCTIVLQLAPE
jgi:hypothetical protein